MADKWVAVVNEMHPRYLKGAVDNTIRSRLWLSMMERRGLIKTGLTSYETRYDVDYKEPPVESFGFGGSLEYEPRDYLKQAVFDVRGYEATDTMHLKEKEMLGGDSTIVNRYKRIIPKLVKGVRQHLGLEIYIDGQDTGNEDRFEGIETFMGTGTNVVADLVGEPDDTYHGLDTDLGQSGTWSADLTTSPNANHDYDWPEGSGSSDWDYWSPLQVNWSSTSWPSGSDNEWSDTAVYALRRTIQWLTIRSGMERSSLMCMMSGAMLSGLKDSMDSKMRVIAPHKEATDLGFAEVINFEGCGCYAEYGVPANTAYMLDMEQVSMHVTGDKMIKSRGPIFDEDSAAYKFFVWVFGNYRFNPRYVAKLYNYAAA